MQTHAYRAAQRQEKITTNYISCNISCVVYKATAQDKILLVNLGITHVVDAADGPKHTDTGPCFCNDTNILYRGLEAPDCKDFDFGIVV